MVGLTTISDYQGTEPCDPRYQLQVPVNPVKVGRVLLERHRLTVTEDEDRIPPRDRERRLRPPEVEPREIPVPVLHVRDAPGHGLHPAEREHLVPDNLPPLPAQHVQPTELDDGLVPEMAPPLVAREQPAHTNRPGGDIGGESEGVAERGVVDNLYLPPLVGQVLAKRQRVPQVADAARLKNGNGLFALFHAETILRALAVSLKIESALQEEAFVALSRQVAVAEPV